MPPSLSSPGAFPLAEGLRPGLCGLLCSRVLHAQKSCGTAKGLGQCLPVSRPEVLTTPLLGP